MESLSNVQEATKASIVKSLANFKKTPKERLTLAYVETRLESLEQHWQVFFKTHITIISTIEQAVIKDSDYHNKGMYEVVEELYIDYKSDLKDRVATLKSPDIFLSPQNRTQSSNFKLPEIKIPVFSGNYLEWQTFKELFIGIIHKNLSLDDTQKLYYLKSYLTGDAAELLKDTPITAENYSSSWKKLGSMYNNKRFLANRFINRLVNQRELSW
ncbi:hypothetical protein ABMA28_010613 [Loxostege sticticalis]|uniref:Uncharacterized protein n=1 Tax=Loxostege sticticalis TaxID=481309 RepID=A0ABD0S8T8_LOXSC